ncbi:carboxymuconolactone decarboxylase family protein [Aspergillus stella-maris]|uniref:carboxymuconolactone decarboxylase family protein n=1 Tax=Aspergillus stella-maris TaxID=1810926 RepID=UPI003CCCC8D3
MRLPYVSDPPATSTPEEADILSKVQARRAPNGLLPLDRALLHSFPVTDGWGAFMGAIRQRTSLTTVIRELVISRVSVLNKAWLEWDVHSAILADGGFSNDALQVARDKNVDVAAKVAEGVLTEAEGAVLKYADAMTKTVTVPDEVFEAVKKHFNYREVVEITTTAAAYNCVSRVLVALDVGEQNR